jgi:hypothetical protein
MIENVRTIFMASLLLKFFLLNMELNIMKFGHMV